MSNPYYEALFDVAPLTTNRSVPLEGEFQRIEAGFDALSTQVNASVRGPDGETLGRLPAAAARASKSFVFDSNGNPAVDVAATSSEMAAAVAAAAAAAASAADADADATTLAASTNAIQYLMTFQGVL